MKRYIIRKKMYNNRDWQIAGREKCPVCRNGGIMAKNLYYGGPILTMKAENDYVESLVEEGGKIIYTGSLEGARKL